MIKTSNLPVGLREESALNAQALQHLPLLDLDLRPLHMLHALEQQRIVNHLVAMLQRLDGGNLYPCHQGQQ
jgi:hypothetical protein